MGSLHGLTTIDPPLWLKPSPELSETTRKASQHLFLALKPLCPKSLLDTLYVKDFDAEQIWQQIELQTESLIPSLKRDVKKLEKSPESILNCFGEKIIEKRKKNESVYEDGSDDEDEEDEGFDDMEYGDEDEEDEDEEDEDEVEDEGRKGKGGFEDRFLKINELEDYMEKDEAREYGGSEKISSKDSDDEEDDEDDEIEDFGDGADDDGVDEMGQAKYEDFFGGKKQKNPKKKSKPRYESEEDEEEDEGVPNQINESLQSHEKELPRQMNGSLSTHEKELEKQRSKIEQMEQENLNPKPWMLQGEVAASKRPKNSVLEADLDFQQSVRPLPVITEEVTASLEDLIKRRILEERFDDVEKTSSIPSRAPKETKELDENKSKKGLAEIYEDEYVQQTGLGPGPVSATDELKKEAELLFGKLCLKLDALSHFHFKPKPIIEDMSIQTNVPAIAMEEVAPVAVSDAAMLAPEEVFSGVGDIKEKEELTQAERKRKRADKKRKFKANEVRSGKKKERSNDVVNNLNVTVKEVSRVPLEFVSQKSLQKV